MFVAGSRGLGTHVNVATQVRVRDTFGRVSDITHCRVLDGASW